MKTFETWISLLAHVSRGRTVYYHAPLDTRPRLVRCARRGSRVFMYAGGERYLCDAAHLSRFRSAL